MPTASERKALVFLAVVAAMGAAARASSVSRIDRDTGLGLITEFGGTERALALQMAAVESAAAAKAAKAQSSKAKGNKTAGNSASAGRVPILETGPTEPRFPIDVDVASPVDLERLPRVGPALARRIVANRDSFGSFGSLDALQYHVRGIGPATAKLLEPLVTFSGRPRPLPSDDSRARRRRTASSDI